MNEGNGRFASLRSLKGPGESLQVVDSSDECLHRASGPAHQDWARPGVRSRAEVLQDLFTPQALRRVSSDQPLA